MNRSDAIDRFLPLLFPKIIRNPIIKTPVTTPEIPPTINSETKKKRKNKHKNRRKNRAAALIASLSKLSTTSEDLHHSPEPTPVGPTPSHDSRADSPTLDIPKTPDISNVPASPNPLPLEIDPSTGNPHKTLPLTKDIFNHFFPPMSSWPVDIADLNYFNHTTGQIPTTPQPYGERPPSPYIPEPLYPAEIPKTPIEYIPTPKNKEKPKLILPYAEPSPRLKKRTEHCPLGGARDEEWREVMRERKQRLAELFKTDKPKRRGNTKKRKNR